MCVRIITSRLPVRLLTSCRPDIQSSTIFACRYLTSSSNNNYRWSTYRTTDSSNSHFSLNAYFSAQQPIRKYDYSTVPKRDTLNKGIIGELSAHRTQQTQEPEPKTESKDGTVDPLESTKKLGLFARFKLMYKQYWYVLIPVHVITSIGWFAGFYYMSQSGVDIPAVLQTLRVSETVIDKLRDSTMGHLAIAYLCYKIATPLRYTVTLAENAAPLRFNDVFFSLGADHDSDMKIRLSRCNPYTNVLALSGGTTISIKYLEKYDYIKPMPTKSELIQMYEDKKADMARRKQERTNEDK